MPGVALSFVQIGRILRRRRAFTLGAVAGGLAVPSLLGFVGGKTLALTAAGSLLCALMVAAFLEYKNPVLWSEEDVVRVLALPVLGTVPLTGSDGDRKSTRARRRTGQAALALLVVAIALALWLRF